MTLFRLPGWLLAIGILTAVDLAAIALGLAVMARALARLLG